MDAIIKFYQEGGWPMHFILLMGILILALCIERILALFVIYGKNPAKVFLAVREAFESGGLSNAEEVAENNAKNPIGSIMSVALQVAKSKSNDSISYEELKRIVSAAVEEEYLRVVPKVQRRVSLIHIFSNSAVLLGLLGAVVGLIEAFAGVAHAEPAQRQLFLAKSISIVMHSTALGLIVAITGIILYSLISSRANMLLARLDEYSVRVTNWVSLIAKGEKQQSK